MPGLFGIVGHSPVSAHEWEDMRATFSRMAAVLRHHADDQLETHDDERASILVGRIGLSHLNARGWPRTVSANSSPMKCFVSGPLDDAGRGGERHHLPV